MKLQGGCKISVIAVVMAIFAVVAVSGMEMQNRQMWKANRMNKLEEESLVTAFDKYLTVEERSLLGKKIATIASKITTFVPTKISKIGEKLIDGIMNAEDKKMWSTIKILEVWAKSRVEKTIINNRQLVKETILEFVPVEMNVMFNRFLDNKEDVETVKYTLSKMAKFLPEAVERFQQSLDTVNRNQINRIIGTYLYTLIEIMPETKWILNVMDQMTEEDYKALGQTISQLDKNWETIIERTSPFLHQQFQEFLQVVNGMTNEEARQYVSAVHRRILNVIMVIRDEADLLKVFDRLLDTIIVSTGDYRKLSRNAMENVERSFPLQNRLMRALDVILEKVVLINSFICQKIQSDNRYFGKRC